MAEYITECYSEFIRRGVDGFRVDTVRHVPRLALNLMFNDQLHAAAAAVGKPSFLMFGEICTRMPNPWYRNHAEESAPYYTWKESNPEWAERWHWGSSFDDINANMNLTFDHYRAEDDPSDEPTSDNAFLNGLDYHTPDRSMASGMEAIDFPVHRAFGSMSGAFNLAKQGDKYYNDATYNVMYVDSHDYAPEQPNEKTRFEGGTLTWAENLNLMFTFRGIPCIYYGSETEFQKGQKIDVGPKAPLSTTGRAYFGDHITGNVTATGFGTYTGASGNVADTLNQPLALVLRQKRIQPVIVKTDVEVVAHVGFEKGGSVTVEIRQLIFVQPVCGRQRAVCVMNVLRFEDCLEPELCIGSHCEVPVCDSVERVKGSHILDGDGGDLRNAGFEVKAGAVLNGFYA